MSDKLVTSGSARAYGPTTRAFHCLTVAALGAQFAIGYLLDVSGRGRGRGRGRGGESGRGRGRDGDVSGLDDVVGDPLLTAHVVIGVTILLLATMRLWWRRRVTLPPWASGLSAFERTMAHWTERALYLLLLVIPATGLWLVLGPQDAAGSDALALHVASYIAFFVVFAAHLGLVLKHQLIDRDRLLRRML